MRLLVFDTSFAACSAAVIERGGEGLAPSNGADEPGTVIASQFEFMETGQAVRLMPMIEEVMARAGTDFDGLGAIATAYGPGSFTGIRISVATARALSLSTGLPVLAFSSLALVAAKARCDLDLGEENGSIATCMDARRDELYVQLFSPKCIAPMSPPQVLKPDAALSLVQGQVIAVGTGINSLASAAAALGRSIDAQLEDTQPDAAFSSVIHMEPVNPLRPLYLRRPDAKPQVGKSLPRVS